MNLFIADTFIQSLKGHLTILTALLFKICYAYIHENNNKIL